MYERHLFGRKKIEGFEKVTLIIFDFDESEKIHQD
jgi:hypothetical protein